MHTNQAGLIRTRSHSLNSDFLERHVKVDFYLPPITGISTNITLLLINDGQDLVTMHFENILKELYKSGKIAPILCVGLHCSADRKNEYGTAKQLDYAGRGTKAHAYHSFILEELLPFIDQQFTEFSFKEKSFCGFSLGGLNALDIVWNNPTIFTKVGVFSGSLWWRNVSQDDPAFDEKNHRIMHRQIRNGTCLPGLKFFFETGTLDETADRNNNGIIDSIDDTLSIIEELIVKGYDPANDIQYLEIKDGKHDVATWARALPIFLEWGWGVKNK